MTRFKRLIFALALFTLLGLVVLAALSIVARAVTGRGWGGGPRLALVRVEGFIRDTSRQVELVREYRDDPHVMAIVVRIDSGGGAVGGSQELYEELRRADEVKPVIVSFGNAAASGGYYIALGGRRIFTNPGTITGSIGVLFTHIDASRLLQETLSVEVTDLTSRPNKDVGAVWAPLTEEDRALLQQLIDDVHGQFVAAVRERRGQAIRAALAGAASREVSEQEIERVLAAHTDGRPLTGAQAIALGFADEAGNLQDAIDHAAALAGISGTPRVEEWRPRRGLLAPLVESAADSIRAALRDELRTSGSTLRFESVLR